jgi:hypothetical protein
MDMECDLTEELSLPDRALLIFPEDFMQLVQQAAEQKIPAELACDWVTLELKALFNVSDVVVTIPQLSLAGPRRVVTLAEARTLLEMGERKAHFGRVPEPSPKIPADALGVQPIPEKSLYCMNIPAGEYRK